jgi:hypothetical protein
MGDGRWAMGDGRWAMGDGCDALLFTDLPYTFTQFQSF